MRILKRRYNDAVYWDPIGKDDYGNQTYAAPIELKVRWENVFTIVQTVRGEQKTSSSTVFTGQDVQEGGVLRQGLITDLTDQTHPFKNSNAGQIMKVEKTPTIRSDDYERCAYL